MRAEEEQIDELELESKALSAEIEINYKEVQEKLKTTEEAIIDFEYEEIGQYIMLLAQLISNKIKLQVKNSIGNISEDEEEFVEINLESNNANFSEQESINFVKPSIK